MLRRPRSNLSVDVIQVQQRAVRVFFLAVSVLTLIGALLLSIRQSGMPDLFGRYSIEAFLSIIFFLAISLVSGIVAVFAPWKFAVRTLVAGTGICVALVLMDLSAYLVAPALPYQMWLYLPYQVRLSTYSSLPETEIAKQRIIVEQYYWSFAPYHCETWLLSSHFGPTPPQRGEIIPEYEVCHDEIGFRNPIDTFNDNAILDTVVLGDSFSYGFGVHKSWPDYFRERSGLKVLNLAQPGGSVPEWIGAFREFGISKSPGVVIAATWDANDFLGLEALDHRNGAPDTDHELEQVMGVVRDKRGSNPLLRIAEYSSSVNLVVQLLSRVGGILENKDTVMTLDLGNETRVRLFANRRPDIADEVSWSLYDKGLRQLKALTDETGSELVLVYFSTASVVYAPYDANPTVEIMADVENNRLISHRLSRLAERSGVWYLDMTPNLQQRAAHGHLLYFWDGHFTEAGNEAVAEAVYGFLVDQGLIVSSQ